MGADYCTEQRHELSQHDEQADRRGAPEQRGAACGVAVAVAVAVAVTQVRDFDILSALCCQLPCLLLLLLLLHCGWLLVWWLPRRSQGGFPLLAVGT